MAVTWQGNPVVLGGWQTAGADKVATDLPTPREHLAVVSDGVYVYAIGGRFLSADKNSAAFERFDPQSNTWTALEDMPVPRGSYGAAYVDGRIVAVGGEDPTQVLGTAEMYDIAEAEWTTMPPMPTPRHHRRRKSAHPRRCRCDDRGVGLRLIGARPIRVVRHEHSVTEPADRSS
jgi:hypothetical protein